MQRAGSDRLRRQLHPRFLGCRSPRLSRRVLHSPHAPSPPSSWTYTQTYRCGPRTLYGFPDFTGGRGVGRRRETDGSSGEHACPTVEEHHIVGIVVDGDLGMVECRMLRVSCRACGRVGYPPSVRPCVLLVLCCLSSDHEADRNPSVRLVRVVLVAVSLDCGYYRRSCL